MIIKNKKQLATTKLRKIALNLIEAGIKSVMPVNLMQSAVKYDAKQKILIIQNKKYNLKNSRIFVVGGGKASGLMAEELEKIIGVKNITAGIVNCKDNKYKTKRIRVIKARHPIPDQAGVRGVKKMLALKKEYEINKNDLIICLISGGASALMPCPADGISLKDIQETTKLLLASGAKIQEINAVRKHLSKIKGGQLAKFFAPATVVSLIISDVVGNNLETIGSGMTVADDSTFQDAYNVLKKYNLLQSDEGEVCKPRLHQITIAAYLKNGRAGIIKETPKKINNCYNYIIGDNMLALNAIKNKACKLGLKPLIVTAEQAGDTAKAAQARALEIINKKYKNYNVILIGGETTPTLPKNHGKGGRNQHFAASSILAMEKYSGNWTMASIGTDGSDYMASAAGAIADNGSLALAKNKGADVELYLKQYNSNALFKKINSSLIITGDTGTNVGDIMIYIFD